MHWNSQVCCESAPGDKVSEIATRPGWWYKGYIVSVSPSSWHHCSDFQMYPLKVHGSSPPRWEETSSRIRSITQSGAGLRWSLKFGQTEPKSILSMNRKYRIFRSWSTLFFAGWNCRIYILTAMTGTRPHLLVLAHILVIIDHNNRT